MAISTKTHKNVYTLWSNYPYPWRTLNAWRCPSQSSTACREIVNTLWNIILSFTVITIETKEDITEKQHKLSKLGCYHTCVWKGSDKNSDNGVIFQVMEPWLIRYPLLPKWWQDHFFFNAKLHSYKFIWKCSTFFRMIDLKTFYFCIVCQKYLTQ